MDKKTANKMMGPTDYGMAVAVGICLLMARVIPEFQTTTACIATLLVLQDNVKVSWKAGITRMIITAVGGAVGIAVILLDNRFNNPWLFVVLCMAGIALTLYGCKLTKVPPFSARIGCITFVLVVLVRTGSDRIPFAIYRLISTFYGIAAVLAVTSAFALVAKWKAGAAAKTSDRQFSQS